jgi:hypothetical protein
VAECAYGVGESRLLEVKAMATIDSNEDLRALYRDPTEGVRRKQIDHLDAGARDFLAATTLAIVATFGPGGADNSPRGGPPGFLRVLGDDQLAFADLSGNNRLDTCTNLLARPDVGMLCIVPGLEETLRINGTARITIDPDVLEATAIDGRVPKVAVVVEVTECYLHCGKALRRAGIWDTAGWPSKADRPSPAAILVGHIDSDIDASVVEASLEADYQETLWRHGGR